MTATHFNAAPGLANMVQSLNMQDLINHRQHARFFHHNPRIPMMNGSPMSATQRLQDRFKDAIEYQFWPKRVAMGTLIGKQFVQVRKSGSHESEGEELFG
jgi:hypothetical protein